VIVPVATAAAKQSWRRFFQKPFQAASFLALDALTLTQDGGLLTSKLTID
jgi:hypothetical protein